MSKSTLTASKHFKTSWTKHATNKSLAVCLKLNSRNRRKLHSKHGKATTCQKTLCSSTTQSCICRMWWSRSKMRFRMNKTTLCITNSSHELTSFRCNRLTIKHTKRLPPNSYQIPLLLGNCSPLCSEKCPTLECTVGKSRTLKTLWKTG